MLDGRVVDVVGGHARNEEVGEDRDEIREFVLAADRDWQPLFRRRAGDA